RQLHKETHCVFVSRLKTQCEFDTHSFHFIPLYPASCLLLPRTTLGCCKESVSFLEVLFLSL
ncbi:unnamed protein product, partial [Brassica oleracea]